MWVTHIFKHRSLHKCTRVERDQDRVEMKSMIDLVLEKRDMLRYVQDGGAVKGMGRSCEVHVYGIRLRHVLEFKYLRCVLDESGKDGAECNRKLQEGRGWQVPSDPYLMLGVCNLSVLESCMKHCLYLFIYMAVRQCYGERRSDVQMDNLRELLGIRRIERVPNAQIRELCGGLAMWRGWRGI